MKRMLITAGPTHEAIDAVRYIANKSSGQMGMALAEAAREAGCKVTLLLGPVAAQAPQGVEVHRFISGGDLETLLGEHFPKCDVLIMSAAVADFRPVKSISEKLARGKENMTIELAPMPDLVAQCASVKQSHQRIVGFALEEPQRLEQRAKEKLMSKKLDAIVANPLETMGAKQIAAKVFTADGKVHAPPSVAMSKGGFAKWLVGWILAG